MKKVCFAAVLLVVATLGTLRVARAETIEETLQKTLPFTAGSRLEISNTNGDIEVGVWDRQEARIEARKKVKADTDERARAALEELKISIDETSQGISIETESARSGSWWRWGVSTSVHYTVSIPDQAVLDLGTVNGKVRVAGVTGDLELHTTNGGITVADSAGRVSARTTNGGIDVELTRVSSGEDMKFRTTNGSIELSLPSDVQASLTARTTNGGVHTDFPITVHGSIGRNRLEGDLNGGGGQIELRTTNGGIRIRER